MLISYHQVTILIHKLLVYDLYIYIIVGIPDVLKSNVRIDISWLPHEKIFGLVLHGDITPILSENEFIVCIGFNVVSSYISILPLFVPDNKRLFVKFHEIEE